MTQRVSLGQAAANAVAAYLKTQFGPGDVAVRSRWPTDKELSTPSVSVVKYGQRKRLDSAAVLTSLVQAVSPTEGRVTLAFAAVVQPIQIDVWCTNDPDRDDIIAQLDDYLYAGLDQTLGVVGATPVRDGILLRLGDGFTGLVDVWMDDPEVTDTPDTVKRREYRAQYLGEARMAFQVGARTVPLMKNITLAMTTDDGSGQAPTQIADTVTISDSGVTYGQS